MHLRRSSPRSSSTTDSLSSSQHSNQGVDCAGVVLDCLFCRFYDMILAARCCPDYSQVATTTESSPGEDDDCDCGLFPCCQDAGDCLELAMETSELCYH
uniref:myoD family inhibitor domain-containing protein 2 n=1 Tax=Gasterosteus aculeatus aculeatus TaxID=481459 RepID=UPI001A998C34|nr:myoD family inhibitor domain-containing protein 2 [Gasterosteus aculeatus aculeatus]